MSNPPPIERLRLVVKARQQLPKKFIWQIVKEDRDGHVTISQSAPQAYDTMETAYDHGKPVLMALRAREAHTAE